MTSTAAAAIVEDPPPPVVVLLLLRRSILCCSVTTPPLALETSLWTQRRWVHPRPRPRGRDGRAWRLLVAAPFLSLVVLRHYG